MMVDREKKAPGGESDAANPNAGGAATHHATTKAGGRCSDKVARVESNSPKRVLAAALDQIRNNAWAAWTALLPVDPNTELTNPPPDIPPFTNYILERWASADFLWLAKGLHKHGRANASAMQKNTASLIQGVQDFVAYVTPQPQIEEGISERAVPQMERGRERGQEQPTSRNKGRS